MRKLIFFGLFLSIFLIASAFATVYMEPWTTNQLGNQHNLTDMDYIEANNISATYLYGSLAWTDLDDTSFPSACPAGSSVTQINHTLTCTDDKVDRAGDTWTGPMDADGFSVDNANLSGSIIIDDEDLTVFYSFDGNHTYLEHDNSVNKNDGEYQLWKVLTNIPGRRDQAGVEYYDGIIYVVGGYLSGSGDHNTTYAYNISADTWSEKAELPIQIQSMVLRVVDGMLYSIGGYNASGGIKYNDTYVYNITADTWTAKADMSVAREDHASAVVDDCIYIFGGIEDGAGHPITNIVERYNTTADTWANMSNMPNPRALGDFGASYNDLIYLVSSDDDLSAYPTLDPSGRVDIYNPSTDTWSQESHIPTGRSYKEVEEVDGKLYVMGGSITTNADTTDNNEIYDIATNSWRTGKDLPTARTGASTASYDGKIYVVGATVGFHRYDTDLETSRHEVDGKFSNALYFDDGKYSYVDIDGVTDIASKDNDYTVEFWFKRADSDTGHQALFASATGVSDRNQIELISDEIRCGYYNGAAYQSVSTSLTATDRDWHHVAMVMTSGVVTGYFDGVLMTGTNDVGGAYTVVTYIGARVDGTSGFNGYVDEFRLWNKTLTATNILAAATVGLKPNNINNDQFSKDGGTVQGESIFEGPVEFRGEGNVTGEYNFEGPTTFDYTYISHINGVSDADIDVDDTLVLNKGGVVEYGYSWNFTNSSGDTVACIYYNGTDLVTTEDESKC